MLISVHFIADHNKETVCWHYIWKLLLLRLCMKCHHKWQRNRFTIKILLKGKKWEIRQNSLSSCTNYFCVFAVLLIFHEMYTIHILYFCFHTQSLLNKTSIIILEWFSILTSTENQGSITVHIFLMISNRDG